MSHANDDGHAANLLGSASLAVVDRMRAAMSRTAPGDSAPAALVALHEFLGGASLDALARVLELTHSGTVRLVDRLAAAGLVERRRGSDARSVSLRLTPAGRRAAKRVIAARQEALLSTLAPLSPSERVRLGDLLGRILAGLTTDHASAGRICRLCDVDACGHPDRCPVTQAAGN